MRQEDLSNYGTQRFFGLQEQEYISQNSADYSASQLADMLNQRFHNGQLVRTDQAVGSQSAKLGHKAAPEWIQYVSKICTLPAQCHSSYPWPLLALIQLWSLFLFTPCVL